MKEHLAGTSPEARTLRVEKQTRDLKKRKTVATEEPVCNIQL